MTADRVKNAIQDSIDLKTKVLKDSRLNAQILNLANVCTESLLNGGKLIFCGNGGSFADAQHLSAEFTSRFLFDRPGLASLVLGANSSALTAIGNDYGFEKIFSREIEALGDSKDILIAITTSANSENIIEAVQMARSKFIYTVVFTGKGKGKLGQDVETLNVPSIDTARIQECHILIGHILCELVESKIFGAEYAQNK